MRISRGIWLVVLACGCAGEVESSGEQGLAWVAPEDGTVLPAGDAIELAVEGAAPDTVEFSIDGASIGTCDPTAADEDCRREDLWRWTAVFASPGVHTVTASYDGVDGPVSLTRELVISAPMPSDELATDDLEDRADLGDAPDEVDVALATVNRGLLDPARAFHRIFGGKSWKVSNQRVVLTSGIPQGSVASVTSCMNRYGSSIRKWADHYKISRASVVATAITESNCSNPAGSSDGLSSGPMQVTASTCAALMGVSRTTCRVKMHTHPDFSFQVGAKYMGSSFQRNQHHRDPPKIAAAYNAGSLHSTTTNAWHMRSTGNHIDRFVRAYNAYRKWEAAHGVALAVARPEPHFEGDQVPRVDLLPTDAAEGQVIFVGDLAARSGGFWQRVDGQWLSTDADD